MKFRLRITVILLAVDNRAHVRHDTWISCVGDPCLAHADYFKEVYLFLAFIAYAGSNQEGRNAQIDESACLKC